MKVGIIGAGLQARRRAPIVLASPDSVVKIVTGETLENAEELANQLGCKAGVGWKEVVNDDDIDVVMVLTPPHLHSVISIEAMNKGKHVFCEKPLSRSIDEAEEMIRVSNSQNKILKCGFNHRHHPAISEAKKMVDEGKLGRLMFARCRYGICGRPGYENEWRADPEKAAGGQFIEQGVHAIDLFRWFMGDIKEVTCMTGVQYFDKQTLDDNGMALFRTETGSISSLHASLTHWKNLFSLEFFGTEAYIVVDGLGGSYGTEKLIFGKRDFNKPFSNQIIEFRGGDKSWKNEWDEFCNAISEDRQPLGNGLDGYKALKTALAAYKSEKEKRTIVLD